MDSYARCLIHAEDWSGLVGLLELLNNYDNGYGVTYLVKYLSEYAMPQHMGRACRAQGQPGFILDAMNQALKVIGQSGDDIWLVSKLLRFGEFRHRIYDEDDEPVRLWEEALSRLSSASTALRRQWARERITYTNSIAQVYFDIAVQNYRGKYIFVCRTCLSLKPRTAGTETNEAVMKLKELASTTSIDPDGDGDIFAYYTPGYPSLLYGRWLRDYEKAPPAVWRKCFRARILELMNGLDDDDPTNDTAACQKLAISLFQAGDRKNAGLILAAIFGTLEKYMAEKSEHRDAEQKIEEENRTQAARETDAAPAQITTPYANEAITATDGTSLVGPHNSLVKGRDTLEQKGQTSSLVLQLASDAWSYTCDGCGLDAEDTGTM